MQQLERFAEKLTQMLQEKYKNDWYPEKPPKGQAYRYIHVNKFQRLDPDVLKACEDTSKEVEVKPSSVAAMPRPMYQISELVFSPLPMWHPLPRKKARHVPRSGYQTHHTPPVPFAYPNPGRENKPSRPIPETWVPPPGMHCDGSHWINPHMLASH